MKTERWSIVGALEGASDLIQLDRLETPTARRWRGSQTSDDPAERRQDGERGKKVEEGADKRERGWRVKQTGTEDTQCWRWFNRRTNLKVPYQEKFPLPVFSDNQSPAQRSQTPRPWNRYGPPNRFNAACHLISSYNDTSLLFVQRTPEAELLARCSAAAPLWRNVCKLDMTRKPITGRAQDCAC